MIFFYFYCNDHDLIMTNLGAFTTICCLVFLTVMLDLTLGVKESKKEGVYMHSYGLRKTIDKLMTYLALVCIGFIIDAMNPIFFYWDIVHLPIATSILALILVYIEGISIKEHLSQGTRKKIRDMPAGIKEVLSEVKDIKNELNEIRK